MDERTGPSDSEARLSRTTPAARYICRRFSIVSGFVGVLVISVLLVMLGLLLSSFLSGSLERALVGAVGICVCLLPVVLLMASFTRLEIVFDPGSSMLQKTIWLGNRVIWTETLDAEDVRIDCESHSESSTYSIMIRVVTREGEADGVSWLHQILYPMKQFPRAIESVGVGSKQMDANGSEG